jgi:hypothetical protein
LPKTLGCGHLALIIEGLSGVMGARSAKDRSVPTTAALIFLAWTRLRRLCGRFEALMAKVGAGRLVAPAARLRTQASPQRHRLPGLPQPLSPPQPHKLPRGFGWLLRLVPETAAYRGQVEYLLAKPDMAALLAASPQARRILRPLCHMLMIEPVPALAIPRRRKPLAAPAAASPPLTPAAPLPARLLRWLGCRRMCRRARPRC